MGYVICKQYGFVPTDFCATFPSVSPTYVYEWIGNKDQHVATLLHFNLVYNTWQQILSGASDTVFNEACKISLKVDVGLEEEF